MKTEFADFLIESANISEVQNPRCATIDVLKGGC